MISMKEYARRRKALMQLVGVDGIVIVPSAPEQLRNGDAVFPYRQYSDFYYLTGFKEPEAVLVLLPKRKEGEFILFNRVRDPAHEVWDGPRAGQKGACRDFHADQAFPIGEFEAKLPELIAGKKTIHYPLGWSHAFDAKIMKGVKAVRGLARKGLLPPNEFIDVADALHEMRVIKSPAEIRLIKKAVEITVEAHKQAMRACKPGKYEYELEAELSYEFQRHGARYPAYTPIVGAGKNSCVLHYVDNNQKIQNDDVVLIDAGAEYEYYAADVTRTLPANGKFSDEQRAIYNIVLEAQLAAIKTVRPGSPWSKAQDTIIRIMTRGLMDLKILKGKLETLIKEKAYLPFYMHGSGHWLGLDVHDVGRYRSTKDKWRTLKTGMILTIEPGIYISAGIKGVHKRWHNIGVRIEDDILVTQKGCEVLSADVPKTVSDIEALMAK